MRWCVLLAGFTASPAFAQSLDFYGVTDRTDIRYSRSLECINYFGNRDYLCRFPGRGFGGVSVRQSFVWFNKQTFRPYEMRLFLAPNAEAAALRALTHRFGNPGAKGETLLPRREQPPLRAQYTTWTFDGGASVSLVRSAANVSVTVAFPLNEGAE